VVNKIAITDELSPVGALPVDPSFALAGTIFRPGISLQTEGGYAITKSKMSQPIETFQLVWENIPLVDRILLRDFYDSHLGVLIPFLWLGIRYHFTSELTGQKINPGVYVLAAGIKKLPTVCPTIHPTSVIVEDPMKLMTLTMTSTKTAPNRLNFTVERDKSLGVIVFDFANATFEFLEAGEYDISLAHEMTVSPVIISCRKDTVEIKRFQCENRVHFQFSHQFAINEKLDFEIISGTVDTGKALESALFIKQTSTQVLCEL